MYRLHTLEQVLLPRVWFPLHGVCERKEPQIKSENVLEDKIFQDLREAVHFILGANGFVEYYYLKTKECYFETAKENPDSMSVYMHTLKKEDGKFSEEEINIIGEFL